MSNLNDFVIEKKALIRYTGDGGDIVIPDGVTKIAPRVFWNNKNVKSIVVPEGVKEIGFRSFSGCEKLEKIILPPELKKIPNEAFSYCPELKTVELSGGITEIGKEAFICCSKLESVVIPDGVTEIGESAFLQCKNLKKVHLPESLMKLGDSAFASCTDLVDINIPESLTDIGRAALFNTAVPMLIIHNQLHSCTCDGDVVIPQGIEVIKSAAFFEKELRSITIPESVLLIEEGAITRFDGEMTIKCSNEKWNLLWESLGKSYPETKAEFCLCYLRSENSFSDECKKILNYISREKDKIFNLIIEASDVSSMGKILNIVKPLTQDTIENYIEKCNHSAEMIAILIQYRKEKYSDMEIEIIKEDKTEKELGIKERTVAEWKEIFTFKVTDGEITISSYKGTDTIVEVPAMIGKNSVILIDKNAFSPNNSAYKDERKKFFSEELTAVVLPDSVTFIGESAFSGCEKLNEVKLSSKLKKIEDHAFYGCRGLLHIELPNTLTSIGSSAFSNCENLKEISIPSKIKKIQDHTFLCCKKLEKISMPDGVKFIGKGTFSRCENLKEVNIPSKLEELDESSFSFCPKLVDERGFVTVAGFVYNYYGMDSEIVLPENTIVIGDRAFEKNKNIKKVVIPEGVFFVGFRAFAECPELESVVIPDSLESTKNYAFDECPKLNIVAPKGKKVVKDFRGSVYFVTE